MATVIVRPNGAGDLTEFLNLSVPNWDEVNEATTDDASFVRVLDGMTSGDLYTVSPHGLSAGDTINSVTIYCRSKCFGSDSIFLQISAGSGVEELDKIIVDDSGFRDDASTPVTTIPVAGGVWTISALNSLQIGAKADLIEVQVRISQMWAVIDYTPGPLGRSWGQIMG